MTKPHSDWLSQLKDFRTQGMRITDINPISALSDVICDQLYKGELTRSDLRDSLHDMGAELWQSKIHRLRAQTGIDAKRKTGNDGALDLDDFDLGAPLYRAVFTAHPVFALTHGASMALCTAAEDGAGVLPDGAFTPRDSVTLDNEHTEAMAAVRNARAAINEINDAILERRQTTHAGSWRATVPQMLGVASWVGYDLDGRSDISWADSFKLRLSEKAQALALYVAALDGIDAAQTVRDKLLREHDATLADIDRFAKLDHSSDDFSNAANTLTQRPDKLVSSFGIADELHEIAQQLADDDKARQMMVISADIRAHGFGMAEVHLRINAVQLRNAMRAVDGRDITISEGMVSTRSLLERLSARIQSEAPWEINFKNIDNEAATARRQLMLAAQFLKHIDSDQPIRLLIAECERPLTLMSALYLAHKLGISDKIDISPLFETNYGLEHGEQIIDQLLTYPAYIDYVKRRGRLAIQTGFSDAGRFVGQIAANMAIERLQVKIAQSLRDRIDERVTLLFFNTHGESLGRGCAQSSIAERQNFIMTPFVRAKAKELGVPLYHQSSFQGGDGYRLFGTPGLARATMNALFAAETAPVDEAWLKDPFYSLTGFSLDMFLALKGWHEALFADPHYGDLLDIFGGNLLPKTGSRPTKRVVQAGNERRDPSKMRAIPHNAILQQLGFLANVISGMGSAARLDTEQFLDIYPNSPRLQQCLAHIRNAKALGSLNTVLAYCRLSDAGFWINRAYHGQQYSNQRAFRKLGQHLNNSGQVRGIQQTVWRLRDDLIDLYRLGEKIGDGSLRNTGEDRSALDILHAIRIAVILDSLVLLCRTPNFAESNHYSNADLLTVGLRLDFETAASIIESAFQANSYNRGIDGLAETENYSVNNSGNYAGIAEQILEPLAENQRIILTVTQMISAHYGAHG